MGTEVAVVNKNVVIKVTINKSKAINKIQVD